MGAGGGNSLLNAMLIAVEPERANWPDPTTRPVGPTDPNAPGPEVSPDGPKTHLDKDKKKDAGRSFASTQLNSASKKRPTAITSGGTTTLGGGSTNLKTLLGE